MRARVRTDDGEHSEWFDATQGGAALRLRSNIVTVQRHGRCCVTRGTVLAVLTRPSEGIYLVQLNDVGVIGTEDQEPLACARRAVWGVLYADDAGTVSNSVEGLARMITVIVVTVSKQHRLNGIGKKDRDKAATNTGPDNPRTTARD